MPKHLTKISVSETSWALDDEPGTRAELLRLLFGPAPPEEDED
jgi:hypothetical protein